MDLGSCCPPGVGGGRGVPSSRGQAARMGAQPGEAVHSLKDGLMGQVSFQ